MSYRVSSLAPVLLRDVSGETEPSRRSNSLGVPLQRTVGSLSLIFPLLSGHHLMNMGPTI